MQDRVSLYPGRVKLEPVAGQANLYDLTRADQPTQEGTPLNKASLLKDTTASLFGLGTDALPDDPLRLLSRFQSGLGNEYLWEKTQGVITDVFQWNDNNNMSVWENNPGTVYYGDELIINSDGTASIVNPRSSQVTIPSHTEIRGIQVVAGHYFHSRSSNKLSPGQTIYYADPSTSFNYINLSCYIKGKSCTVWEKKAVEHSIGFVNSSDESAYPPAQPDGYNYRSLGQLGNFRKICTGTYTATGVYGVSNQNYLTLPFHPELFVIWLSGSAMAFLSDSAGISFNGSGQVSGHSLIVSCVKNAIQWYSTASAITQMNDGTNVYSYVAFG